MASPSCNIQFNKTLNSNKESEWNGKKWSSTVIAHDNDDVDRALGCFKILLNGESEARFLK